MTIRIGNHEFDKVRYDDVGDVLYLRMKGAAPEALTDATPEGHAVTFDASGALIGMTIVNAKWLTEKEGKVVITLPERIETSAAELEPALR
jgi:uncharacterized protein YuzE